MVLLYMFVVVRSFGVVTNPLRITLEVVQGRDRMPRHQWDLVWGHVPTPSLGLAKWVSTSSQGMAR